MWKRERVRRVEPRQAELMIGLDLAWAVNFCPWLGCLQEGKGSGARAYAARLCEDYMLRR